MNIDYFKNIHFIECENWCNAYGYEKAQMKEDTINYIKQLEKENQQLKEQVIDISNSIKYRNVSSAMQQRVLSYQIELENHYKIRYHELHDNWNKLKDFIAKEYYMHLPLEASTKSITTLIDKIQELEQGSDSDE